MASSLTPRSPYQKKENLGSLRRGMGYNAPPRRNVLSAINNGGGANAEPAPSEAGSEAPAFEFSGREDVDRLLSEKMKGKSKNDYKVFLLPGFPGVDFVTDLWSGFLNPSDLCRAGRSR
uniref:Uncharacterized protein n=1 Tax=Aegilops tauschii subsp. strangulata TaxID=200361 RepID=A0A453D1Z8_AEGTS